MSRGNNKDKKVVRAISIGIVAMLAMSNPEAVNAGVMSGSDQALVRETEKNYEEVEEKAEIGGQTLVNSTLVSDSEPVVGPGALGDLESMLNRNKTAAFMSSLVCVAATMFAWCAFLFRRKDR